jgi:hypothetical protein
MLETKPVMNGRAMTQVYQKDGKALLYQSTHLVRWYRASATCPQMEDFVPLELIVSNICLKKIFLR